MILAFSLVLPACAFQVPSGIFECDTDTECPGGFSCWADKRCYATEELPDDLNFVARCGLEVTRNGSTVTFVEDLNCTEEFAITVTANDVDIHLNGYSLTNAGESRRGIDVHGGDDVRVFGSPVSGSTAALRGEVHSRIEGFNTGIMFREVIGGSISDVWVSDMNTGFGLSGGTRNVVLTDLAATGPTFAGIVIRFDSDQNEVYRFQQQGGNNGIDVEESDDIVIRGCDIVGPEGHGIMIGVLPFGGEDRADNAIVTENYIADSTGNGILVHPECNVSIEANEVVNSNLWGIKAPAAALEFDAEMLNQVEGSGEPDQCLPSALCG